MRFEGSHTLIEDGRCSFGEKCEHMRIYGYYLDVRGIIRKCFLGFDFECAIVSVHPFHRVAFGNVRFYDVNGLKGYDVYMGDGLERMVYHSTG